MKRLLMTGLALAASLAAAGPSLAGDAAAGKALYGTCVACHGANGEGMQALHAPRLAGQEPWYVVTQLKNFKSGARGTGAGDTYGMTMRPMAMTLADDAAIENVAAYIATLTAPDAAPSVTGDAAAGKALFGVCASCHGANGEGNKAMNAPKLAGQPGWYLVTQLKNYKSGARGTGAGDTFGMTMRPMAMTLADDAAINNVVAYIESL